MFEAWLSDLLASYLGHFLDVKPEALRVSLWKGENDGRAVSLSFRPSLYARSTSQPASLKHNTPPFPSQPGRPASSLRM